MKKIFLISLLFVTANAVAATTYWWEQPTICRISTTKCYTSMSDNAGYETNTWDNDANCRGVKLVCGEALTSPKNYPITMGRNAIQSGSGISSDYDISVLNTEDNCFGVRKTSTDGSMASVDGQMVRVWCPDILDSRNIQATIETGDIAITTPSCQSLADNGYAAVPNGKCYGKYYNPSLYYIECLGGTTAQLIVLNGATDYDRRGTGRTPRTQADADDIFDAMHRNVHSAGE